METCPECNSNQILSKSSVKEFNPEGLFCCCKCLCHFKGKKIFRKGKNFKSLNKWLRRERKYEKRKARKKKTPKRGEKIEHQRS